MRLAEKKARDRKRIPGRLAPGELSIRGRIREDLERLERILPDLPGLGVAAATIEETERLLREGLEPRLAGMREDGLPIPIPAARFKQIAIPA